MNMTTTILRRGMYVCGLAILTLSALSARADSVTLFTNLGTGGTFDPTNGNLLGPHIWASPFTASTTASVTDAILPLQYPGSLFGGQNNALELVVESDINGLPGVPLDCVAGGFRCNLRQQDNSPSISPSLVRFACSFEFPEIPSTLSCPLLNGGTQYWLAAYPAPATVDTQQYWFNSNTDLGSFAFAEGFADDSSRTAQWVKVESTNSSRPAFQINGTAVVPEPSSFVLLGTGLLGFVGVLRRKYLR